MERGDCPLSIVQFQPVQVWPVAVASQSEAKLEYLVEPVEQTRLVGEDRHVVQAEDFLERLLGYHKAMVEELVEDHQAE